MAQMDEMRASLDEIKAAIFVLTDRLSQSTQDIETSSAGLQAVSRDLRQALSHKGSFSAGGAALPDAVVAMPLKLDALTASQARIEAQLEMLLHAAQQLPLQVEAGSAFKPVHEAAMKSAVSTAIDTKLANMALLESELLSQSRETKAALAKLSSEIASVSAPSVREGYYSDKTGTEFAYLRQSVEKSISDGEKREETIAQTLGAMLDAITAMKDKTVSPPQHPASQADSRQPTSQPAPQLDGPTLKSIFSQELDAKLASLARLNTEILEETRKASAQSLAQGKSQPGPEGVASLKAEIERLEGDLAKLRDLPSRLEEISLGQQKQSELLSDVLSTLLDSAAQRPPPSGPLDSPEEIAGGNSGQG